MTPSGTPKLALSTHGQCRLHNPGTFHPERPDRLTAVRDGIIASGLSEGVSWHEAPMADRLALTNVHPESLLDGLSDLCAAGGGPIDADTVVSSDSNEAALRAAGAGLDLIKRLKRGEAETGWSIVRPPGHHATPSKQMGFCLLNNIAVAAEVLAVDGERVAIVDIDAHHGNGTQEAFYDRSDVLFVSFHEYPAYPGTGRPTETGSGDGVGTTVNIALPSGATGDVYRGALDSLVGPIIEQFGPTWLLISAGFDAHRADPLTNMGLTAADYADITAELVGMADPGRRLLFLEGGYDLDALANTAGAVASALVGHDYRPESSTSGGPGFDHVEAAKSVHHRWFK